MSTSKLSRLKLGPGFINDKNFESEIFAESRAPLDGTAASAEWNVGTLYSIGDPVIHEEVTYNALQSNIGKTPGAVGSELDWAIVDGKDGDIWIQVPTAGFPAGGTDSEVYIKVGSVWRPMSDSNPKTVALINGTVSEETAFKYKAAALPYAVVSYTVRRGTGHGEKRQGLMIILNSGAVFNYTHEFTEIGSDVNVPFSVDYDSGDIRLRYTSVAGSAIELRYIIKGWV